MVSNSVSKEDCGFLETADSSIHFRRCPKMKTLIAMTALLMLCFSQSFSATQNAWTQSVSGTFATLHSVLWSGQEFIAVGDSGVVLTSGDGLAWTKQVSGTSKNLLAATWAGTKVLACGDSGTLIYSGNGLTWQKIDIGLPNARIGAIAWSVSQFVASYGSNSLVLSKDGSSWTLGTAPGPIDSTALQLPTAIQSICWSGSYFVLFQNEYNWCSGVCYCMGSIVQGESYKYRISSSKDGITWTGVDSSLGGISGFVGGTGTSIAVVGPRSFSDSPCNYMSMPEILTSQDGTKWVHHTVPTQINIVDSGMLTSINLNAVTWTGSKFVTVGDSGTILIFDGDTTWANAGNIVTDTLLSVVSNGNCIVTVGSRGTILTTPASLGVVSQPCSRVEDKQWMSVQQSGARISIRFPQCLNGKTLEISIHSLNGRLVRSFSTLVSNGSLVVPDFEFPNGMYLFTCKIIHGDFKTILSFVRR
jgi:hypothetical protein